MQTYQFQKLKRVGLVHAVFTRKGGVSQGEFHSLNLGENTKDNPTHLAKNMQLVQQTLEKALQEKADAFLGVASLGVARLEQKHGLDIQEVDSPGLFHGDALITQKKNLALMIRHADCQAAICYDPQKQVLALIHAGWRAQAQFFYTKVMQRLIDRYGVNPKNLYVAISPSLGPQRSEFIHYEQEFPKQLHRYHIGNKYLDLWKMAQDEWELCGVPKQQVEISRVCTFCHQEEFFSYRRSKESARNATVAVMSS